MNPELKKNIWTELSINRLVIMPVVLAFVFSLVYVIFSNDRYVDIYEVIEPDQAPSPD